MAVTWTCGGASSGYCAIGSVGIDAAPARMMTSDRTIDRMGRRMKMSANMRALVWEKKTSALRLHGRSVADLLDTGHDQAVPDGQAAFDDVVVADELADLDGALPGDEPAALRLDDEGEVLPGDARDRHGRHGKA